MRTRYDRYSTSHTTTAGTDSTSYISCLGVVFFTGGLISFTCFYFLPEVSEDTYMCAKYQVILVVFKFLKGFTSLLLAKAMPV